MNQFCIQNPVDQVPTILSYTYIRSKYTTVHMFLNASIYTYFMPNLFVYLRSISIQNFTLLNSSLVITYKLRTKYVSPGSHIFYSVQKHLHISRQHTNVIAVYVYMSSTHGFCVSIINDRTLNGTRMDDIYRHDFHTKFRKNLSDNLNLL